jgi:hypothetical protein
MSWFSTNALMVAGDDIPATAAGSSGEEAIPALLPPTAPLVDGRHRRLRADQPEQTVDGEAFGADLGTEN